MAASIISLFILQLSFLSNSNSEENNSKSFSNDSGVLSLMYHRFNENKYPSTNIKMHVFDEQMQIIKNLEYKFYDPKLFEKEFDKKKNEKKILITIDDGFQSFYQEAWPYLKKNNIPFILFVSTEPVGRNGYMTWDQIMEIENSKLGIIGHHSHSHEYLIDMTNEDFITENDIKYEDLQHIFVNQGPGSFSGIRTSLSAVKGISLSKNIKLHGYDTFKWACSKFYNKKKIIICLIKMREKYFFQEFDKNLNITFKPKEISIEEIIEKYKNDFKVIPKNLSKKFDSKILNLKNIIITELNHEELEFLYLRGLLDKDLIKPLYLS